MSTEPEQTELGARIDNACYEYIGPESPFDKNYSTNGKLRSRMYWSSSLGFLGYEDGGLKLSIVGNVSGHTILNSLIVLRAP